MEEWNKLLREKVEVFRKDTPSANVVLLSAYSVIADILDRPVEYGFDEKDAEEEGGAIWRDELHVTSQVHEILALQLLEKAS